MNEEKQLKKYTLILVYILAPFLMSEAKILNIIYYLLLILFIVKVKKTGYKKTGYETGLILFFMGITLGAFFSADILGVIKLFERALRAWMLVVILGQYSFDEKEKNFFLILISVGLLRLLGLGIAEKLGYIQGRYLPRISGGYKLWVYTMWICIYISGVFTLLFFKKKKIELFYLFSIGGLSIYVLMITMSRSSWLAIIGIIVALILIKKSKNGIILLVLSGILTIGILNLKGNEKYLSRVKSIASLKSYSNATRIDMYKYGFEIWEENKFGIGLKQYKYTDKKGKIFYHAHNDYVEILSENGFLGLFGFLILMGLILKNNLKVENKYNIIVFMSFLSMIIYGFFESPIHYPQVQQLLYAGLGVLGYKKWEYKPNVM
ncbi:O-antigen ligase family protein [Psychrilyobacter atlanticus]|uniref:O-antigen ligase family protein n=1 Tax=Psychrilyobacter atlanticus TaxID=271091 RepID=UPI000405A3CC|nr:O-antigen ligase family protein [Psychrilyobacter atlanticus]